MTVMSRGTPEYAAYQAASKAYGAQNKADAQLLKDGKITATEYQQNYVNRKRDLEQLRQLATINRPKGYTKVTTKPSKELTTLRAARTYWKQVGAKLIDRDIIDRETAARIYAGLDDMIKELNPPTEHNPFA